MKLFAKLLFAVCLLAALSFDLSAQVGEVGGPIVDIELIPVCDDGTTAFQVLQYVVGVATPTSLGYVDAAGAAYTLTGTPTAGACDGGSGGGGPDYTVSVLSLCDSGTPFYRVAVFTDNASTASVTADFELDLSTAYTVAGTVYTGPCYTSVTSVVTRSNSTATGSFAAGALSYEICNDGTSNAVVTINASASILIPGSCTSFKASESPITRQYRTAPAVSWDATGTILTVIVEN